MSYRTQFPAEYHPDTQTVTALQGAGFADSSWGNDTCPSFTRGELTVYVEPEDADLRECAGLSRYTVYGPDSDDVRFESESLPALMAFLTA